MDVASVLTPMVTIGVIGDTHVPDRARRLNPDVLPLFESAGVNVILHTGDVSTPGVLRQLSQVAPVHAVRGNRDWLRLGNLPMNLKMEFNGVVIGMTHGHGSWGEYFVDRIYFTFHHYHHERLLPRLFKTFPDVKVIVFGHGHVPLNQWMQNKLLFNPGSPHFPDKKDLTPSLGLLHITTGSEVWGEIINLD